MSVPFPPQHKVDLISTKTDPPAESPHDIAQAWIDKLLAANSSLGDSKHLSTLFIEDCWWRDHLALTWDYHTLHTLPNVAKFLSSHLPSAELHDIRLQKDGQYVPKLTHLGPSLMLVESMIHFETRFGSGKGVVRLVPDDTAASGRTQWKCYTIYLALQSIREFPPSVDRNRPNGGKNDSQIPNWAERRAKQYDFRGSEPTVLCIGAGHSGLNVAAWLEALGVSTLIIDRNARVGDNWRLRYRSLVTHDPVYSCHMPFVPFPPTWPFFTPKDKMADWLETYASILELNVWSSTSITASEWDEAKQQWTVTVRRGGKDVPDNERERVIHPRHIIFCTGHSGEPVMPSLPGQETFKGTVYHGSKHQDANPHSIASHAAEPAPRSTSDQPRKVIVVGTGNSGHDIAQNYYESNLGQDGVPTEVTMLQRGPTNVITAGKGVLILNGSKYADGGPPVDDADVDTLSMPIPVTFALLRGVTQHIENEERDILDGLDRAGFQRSQGIHGGGILSLYWGRGGGYYVDVGASSLIAEGKIKVVHSPEGIQGFDSAGLILADGRRLPADIVVFATGYDNMRTTVRKVLGSHVADRAKDVWGLDDEGEMRAMWRPSGHPGLWYMGGNFQLCRVYSRLLALQIKAAEEGLVTADYTHRPPA